MKRFAFGIDWVECIDTTIYILLGLISFFYIFFLRVFAEWCINFPGLEFPIFIGEIVLGFCLLLCGLRQWLLQEPFGYKYRYWLIFGLLILGKAGIGYWHHGVLALRDAAMFYYVFFALITYHCFQKSVVSRYYWAFVTIALLGWIFYVPSNWVWGYTVLGWMIVRRIPQSKWRVLGYILLVCLIPYNYYFNNAARMLIIGNLFSIFFIIIVGIMIQNQRGKFGWKSAVTVVLIILLGTYVLAQNQKVVSAFNVKDFWASYSFYNKRYLVRKDQYKFIPIAPNLYNPDANHQLNFGLLEQELQSLEKQSIDKLRISSLSLKEKSEESSNTITSDFPKVTPSIKSSSPISSSGISPSAEPRSLSSFSSSLVKRIFKPNSYDDLAFLGSEQYSAKVNNAIFRIFIWQDMWDDLRSSWPIFGFDFGKPLRSKRIEVLNWAKGEWSRDGWIAAHNSYFNIIYRMGMIGLALIVIYWMFFFNMCRVFIVARYWEGIALLSVILGWSIAANFLLIWELPYTAVPFWVLFGFTKALADRTLAAQHKEL